MVSKFLTLDQIRAYKIASDLADYVWEIVINWELSKLPREINFLIKITEEKLKKIAI